MVMRVSADVGLVNHMHKYETEQLWNYFVLQDL